MARNYARIFAILKDVNTSGINLTYKEAVSSFTGGVTDSLSSLSNTQLEEFATTLEKMVVKKDTTVPDKLDKTRKAIIAQFKSIGKTTANAIAWAEKYGVFGKKKKFNDYNGQELFQLLKNAEIMKRDYIKKVNRQSS